MRNFDLETFHNRIKNSIQLVSSYTGNERYIKIIRSCRLKPIEAFEKHFKWETKLYPIWIDEFGYSLNVTNGLIEIHTDNKYKNSTDLFYGRNKLQYLTYSKRAILLGSEQIEQTFFYCDDDYIRGLNGNNRVSAMELGLDILNIFNDEYSKLNTSLDVSKLGQTLNNYNNCLLVSIPIKIDVDKFFIKGTK